MMLERERERCSLEHARLHSCIVDRSTAHNDDGVNGSLGGSMPREPLAPERPARSVDPQQDQTRALPSLIYSFFFLLVFKKN